MGYYLSLEAANDLLFGFALPGAPRHVRPGTLVVAHTGEGDHVKCAIGIPVAPAVQAMADYSARGSGDRSDPGFNFSVLSEFRSRLLEGGKQSLLLEELLEE